MKAKRRQELKTNDLAQALEDLSQWFKDQGVYVVVAAALVVTVVVIVSYRNSARAEGVERAYAELREVSNLAPSGVRKSDAEIERALTRIGELAAQSTDASFKLDALLRRGDLALRLAESGITGIDVRYLAQARSAFEEIVRDNQDRTLHYGRALYGLFQVEANEFADDTESRHREQAVEHLKRLRDDERFNGLPFQKMAVDALNDLDSVFAVVTFPKRPAIPSAPVPFVVPGAAAQAPPAAVGGEAGSLPPPTDAGESGAATGEGSSEQSEPVDTENLLESASAAETPAPSPTP